ncbi:unnamed protein product, partial [Polarella glacialis]
GMLATPSASQEDGCDARCHTVFLPNSDGGQHKYSVLRNGPWLLLMLWQVAKESAELQAGPGDPFGIDLSMDLLESLPRFEPEQSPTAGKPPPAPSSSSARTPGSDRSKRSFGMPCASTIFKPLARTSPGGSRKASPSPDALLLATQPVPPPRVRPDSFLYALDLRGGGSALQDATEFAKFQEPARASWPRLPEASDLRPSCPVLSARANVQRCSDWAHADAADLVAEWSDADLLCKNHAS